MKYPLLTIITYILLFNWAFAGQLELLPGEGKKVYVYQIHDEIGPGATRVTDKAIEEAYAQNADYLLLDLNTFGGLVDDADEIRTALLDCKIPTLVFIQNNAASAGALISIACDSIYMNTGSTIGAAAVVYEDGSYAEEKYQSYMRNKMRATAEATNRNPDIAEGMVNPKVVIEGVTTDDEIITFSVDEAIKNGYCNAKAETVEEVLKAANLEGAEIIEHHVSNMEKLIQILVQPYISGILLMFIIGGLYFELKTPGVGFPLAVSIMAAILYFAPQYLEGVAAYWEILLFLLGVILLGLEIFLIPGFGVTGIAGIAAIMISLALALVKNVDGFDFGFVPVRQLGMSFLMVSFIMVFGVLLLLFASKNLAKTKAFKRLALETEQTKEHGFVISAVKEKTLEGKEGVVVMDMRPSGKIDIDGEMYDAQSDGEYLSKGQAVIVRKQQGAYLLVNAKHA